MSKLREISTGVLSLSLYVLNTILWSVPVYTMAILKFLIRNEAWQNQCSLLLTRMSQGWIAVNNFNAELKKNIRWDVEGMEGLNPNDWYLILSNHQTWVDILVLQKVFDRKIPFLKFFLKKELIWVPILGLAWWALDFPFMKRYSEAFLKKHPTLKGKDIETTRRACEKFKTLPISLMNFVEGTRFTQARHDHQHSPYTNLLKPKAGGTAFVLSAMGSYFNAILNVTIAYPQGNNSFWAFACGRITEIIVRVELLPLKEDLLGDYSEDKEFRELFQSWINSLWADKDRLLTDLKAQIAPRTGKRSSN
jgi:1-acyl-sn-glycerol-3-phosphate acyltransferase